MEIDMLERKLQILGQTLIALNSQIDNYPQNENLHGVSDLQTKSQELLYEGTRDSSVHRKAFTQHIVHLMAQPNGCKCSDEDREANPENATITTKKFLGPDGLILYQAALAEEANSRSYRSAVFNESTRYIDSPKWEKPPAIIIAGPSGCGKTRVTKEVIDKLENMPTIPGETGNLVTSVDGGVVREVSQMRKLLIQAATIKQYSGISDLHQKSEALENVKPKILSAALADQKFGLAIPETYSHWSMFLKTKVEETLDDVMQSPRTTVFCSIQSKNKDFNNVVQYMGDTRAWKTDGFYEMKLDLNSSKGLPESKAYGSFGFTQGVRGSKGAHDYYVKMQGKTKKPDLTIDIFNDLIVVKPSKEPIFFAPVKLPVTPADQGTFLVSKAGYDAWMLLPLEQKRQTPLNEYAKQHGRLEMNESPALAALLAPLEPDLRAGAASASPMAEQTIAGGSLGKMSQLFAKAAGKKAVDGLTSMVQSSQRQESDDHQHTAQPSSSNDVGQTAVGVQVNSEPDSEPDSAPLP